MFDRGDDKQRDYQWLVKPDGALTVALGDFTMKNKDRILKSFNLQHATILMPTVKIWVDNIKKVLQKLADTNPDDTCLGEIYYWRDVSRLLSAVDDEFKLEHVVIAIECLKSLSDIPP